MENIVFFNHWHYGDLFSTRGLVADIKRQLPDMTYYYAHNKNGHAVSDLVETLDEENNKAVLDGVSQWNRFGSDDDTILINTWVGAYMGLWANTHPSYISHHRIFAECYNDIRQQFGIDLKLSDNVWDYVPTIDYNFFDVSAANKFILEHPNFYLFCNSAPASKQSSMDNMQKIIELLAKQHPDHAFVVTEKFETKASNIFFTSDIFNIPNDLCEISYLSTKTNLIVGNNSGPFTYAQTKENLQNPQKIFINFSHKAEDTLPFGLDISASFRFSNTTYSSPAAGIIRDAMEDIINGKYSSGYRNV